MSNIDICWMIKISPIYLFNDISELYFWTKRNDDDRVILQKTVVTKLNVDPTKKS